MLRVTFALVVTLASGCAALKPTDNWTPQDTRRELYYGAALAVDSWTTNQFRDAPKAFEGNRIVRRVLGPEPEADELLAGSLVAALAHYWIARKMPPEWRPYWQFGFTFLHGNAAVRNCRFSDISLC